MKLRIRRFNIKDVKEWKGPILLTILAVYAYIFLEWLFIHTNPSFLIGNNFVEQFRIIFNLPLFILVYLLMFSIPLIFVWFGLKFLRLSKVQLVVSGFVPTFLISSLLFILIDNFSYTIFGFGVSTISKKNEIYYLLFFIFLFILLFRSLFSPSTKLKIIYFRESMVKFINILFGISLVSIFLVLILPDRINVNLNAVNKASIKPDIIFLSADALESRYMSIYNPEYDTTPFLLKFQDPNLVVFKNGFVNFNATGGSMSSLLTGKYPTTTKKFHLPHILRGKDAFEHLPGILKRTGYTNFQTGSLSMTDAIRWNMRDGFDWINNKRIDQGEFGSLRLIQNKEFYLEVYFLRMVLGRFSSTVLKLFGYQPRYNISGKYEHFEKPIQSDSQKTNYLLEFLNENQGPVFAHVHYMSTHYSHNYQKKITWDDKHQHYLKGIKIVDHEINRVIDYLKENSRWDRTLLVIFTDHGIRYVVSERSPMIFRFPTQIKLNNTDINVQNLDIAPTIIDYLGITIPSWMEGRSLFSSIGIYDPVMTILADHNKKGIVTVDGKYKSRGGPQIGHLLICNKVFMLNLISGELSKKEVDGHTLQCEDDKFPSEDKIKKLILDHFSNRGYNVLHL